MTTTPKKKSPHWNRRAQKPKVQFSEEEARRVALKMQARDDIAMNAYSCKCGSWHVGRASSKLARTIHDPALFAELDIRAYHHTMVGDTLDSIKSRAAVIVRRAQQSGLTSPV